MSFDQRHDEQPIRNGELPIIVEEPSEDLGDFPEEDEFEETPFSKWTLPICLFVATVFTTLWAGAYQAYRGPISGPVDFLLEHPELLGRGIPFAATLLLILMTHECGHYVLSRIHQVPASLPLFIPGPPYFIGTFGAIIRLRGPILNRRGRSARWLCRGGGGLGHRAESLDGRRSDCDRWLAAGRTSVVTVHLLAGGRVPSSSG